MIASCLGGGLTSADVALVQNGADGDFVSDNLIGFGFKLSKDAAGYTRNQYVEFKVGTGTLTPPVSFPDSDANLVDPSSGSRVTQIPTTATDLGKAVTLLDFRLSDGGDTDGLPLSVTGLAVNISGTAASSVSKLTWLLNGPGATNVQGTLSGSQIVFGSLSIQVADGQSETYTVSAYFNDNTGLTEGQAVALQIDGENDVTLGSESTKFGTTTPVGNGGIPIAVEATKLAFTTQPSGSTSGSALTTQPIVTAQDEAGNTDTDFTGSVTLSEASAGSLSGYSPTTAVSGVATFSGIIYTATADQQSFTLTAESGSLTPATSGTVFSDVVATKLVFSTEPAPTSFNGNAPVVFTSYPVVLAVDAKGVLDAGYTQSVVLSAIDGAGSANLTGNTETPVAGVATFSGLGLTYSNSGKTTETFKLEASSGSLTKAESAELTARLAPTVLGVSATTSNGTYKAGDTVSIQITFNRLLKKSALRCMGI